MTDATSRKLRALLERWMDLVGDALAAIENDEPDALLAALEAQSAALVEWQDLPQTPPPTDLARLIELAHARTQLLEVSLRARELGDKARLQVLLGAAGRTSTYAAGGHMDAALLRGGQVASA